jgi:hypothetical protein
MFQETSLIRNITVIRQSPTMSPYCAGMLCRNADNAGINTFGGGSRCRWCDGICHQECGVAAGERTVCFQCERQRLAHPAPVNATRDHGVDVLETSDLQEQFDLMAEDEVVRGEVADVNAPLPMETPRPSRQARQRPTPTRPSGQPSLSIEAIQSRMNLANVKKRTSATKTWGHTEER